VDAVTAVHVSVAVVESPRTERPVGVVGAVVSTAVLVEALHADVPVAFLARIWNTYSAPVESAVTEYVVAVLAVPVADDQIVPAFDEYRYS
jgi:hypothetical protein